jgi:Concanavalin A-like lectin/glucanases superfamily
MKKLTLKLLVLLLLLLLPLNTFGARDFDGSNDKIDFGNSSELAITGDLSFGIWLQIDNLATSADMICFYGGNSENEEDNFIFYFDVQGSPNAWDLRYLHEYSSGSNELNTFNTNITNSTWTYVAITRDVSANTVDLWTALPGATLSNIGTFSYTNDPTGGAGSGAELAIGEAVTGSQDLNGILADLVLYDRALTVEEHQQNMTGNIIKDSNLKFHGPLWGSSPEPDLSGNTNNGTVSGSIVVDHAPTGAYVLY